MQKNAPAGKPFLAGALLCVLCKGAFRKGTRRASLYGLCKGSGGL